MIKGPDRKTPAVLGKPPAVIAKPPSPLICATPDSKHLCLQGSGLGVSPRQDILFLLLSFPFKCDSSAIGELQLCNFKIKVHKEFGWARRNN